MPLNQQLENSPYLDLNGFIISGVSTTSFFVSVGACRDSTNTVDIVVPALQVDCANIGVVNGLDTGALAANLDYYVFAIANTSLAQSPALLVSRSSTAPKLPSAYDCFRRVGFLSTNGSAQFNAIYYAGTNVVREGRYINGNLTATTLLSAGTSTTFALVPSTFCPYFPFQPLGNGTIVFLAYVFTPATGGNSFQVKPEGDTSTTCFINIKGPVTAQPTSGIFQMYVGNNRKLNYLVSNSSDSLSLYVAGFKDHV